MIKWLNDVINVNYFIILVKTEKTGKQTKNDL